MSQDAAATDSNASGQPASRKLTILDLPHETQQDIFDLCSQSDLICLSLVSRHFRELAAAPLYRNFHIVFPDEDDPAFDSPIDGLAGGLDTFVTSDYDYAKHLRDVSLDTLSAGDKAESAYKPYLYHVSCGKFMNTLLLLTLRKAKALESFRWNIRVELSRQVYRALHQIDTLHNLQIRLQAGPSLYETPPTLPYVHPSSTAVLAPTSSTYLPEVIISGGPPPPPPTFSIPPPTSIFYAPPTSLPPPPLPKPPVRPKAPKKSSTANEPPTLSGFKGLKKLAVLDIDSLDMVSEIKSCLKNSSGSLTKLKLSFSDELGLLARKPAPEVDPDDSDPDDEFQAGPAASSTPYADDVSGPAKVFRAQEERKTQETVLGRIFDVEQSVVKKPLRKIREKEKESIEDADANPGRAFITAIKSVSSKLMKDLTGGGEPSTVKQEILDIIEAAARKYVASEDGKRTSEEKPADGAGPSSSPGPTSSGEKEQNLEVVKEATEEAAVDSAESARIGKTRQSGDDVKPEDINIEEPEEQLVVESQDSSSKETPTDTPADESEPATEPSTSLTQPEAVDVKAESADRLPTIRDTADAIAGQLSSLQALIERLQTYERRIDELDKEVQKLRSETGMINVARIAAAETQMRTLRQYVDDISEKIHVMEALLDSVAKDLPRAIGGLASSAEAQNKRASEYVRATRGLALQSLSIYLVPVKASVLSRAVDLRVLRRLTLLNVGPQAPIWALLARENKVQPLPLRKIFTDNVSTVFLNFLTQLEELHELFMLERDPKYKPESFAPRSPSTMEQIRRLVLRKHLPKLRRLMIKNQAGQAWDIDQKTMLLICRRGAELQELAININIKTMHVLLQNLSGLISLRALHIVQLRNDDTCVWVMRETKKFLIDNVSHHPHLKLEWISVDDEDRVERLQRPSDVLKAPDDKNGKGTGKEAGRNAKGKQKATAATGVVGSGVGVGSASSDMFPVLPSIDSLDGNDGSDSDEQDEDEETGCLKTQHAHFYDVWGVRIFKKEIVAGRL